MQERERSERTSLVYRAPADKLSKAENNMITFSCRLGGATCNKTDFRFHEVYTWNMQNLILHVQSKQAFPYPVGAEPQGGYSEFRVTGMIEGFFWVWKFRFRDIFGYENLAWVAWFE